MHIALIQLFLIKMSLLFTYIEIGPPLQVKMNSDSLVSGLGYPYRSDSIMIIFYVFQFLEVSLHLVSSAASTFQPLTAVMVVSVTRTQI